MIKDGPRYPQVPRPPVKAVPVLHLHPGQMAVFDEPKVLATILGSCVAVCLWDPIRRAGGMIHYLLPQWEPGSGTDPLRYGDAAVDSLIREMLRLGCRKSQIQAHVYGGACVLGVFRREGQLHLGERNAEMALRKLAVHQIPVRECDIAGTQPRKLLFDLATGSVVMKRLEASHGN